MEATKQTSLRKRCKKYFTAAISLGDGTQYYGAASVEDYFKWRLLFYAQIAMTKRQDDSSDEWDEYEFYSIENEKSISIPSKQIKKIIQKIERVAATDNSGNHGWYAYKAQRGRKCKLLLWKYGGEMVDNLVKAIASRLKN